MRCWPLRSDTPARAATWPLPAVVVTPVGSEGPFSISSERNIPVNALLTLAAARSQQSEPRYIALFAGTEAGILPIYEQAGHELGLRLAEQRIGLVVEGNPTPSGVLHAVMMPVLAAGLPVIQVVATDQAPAPLVRTFRRWEVADRTQGRRVMLERAAAVLFLPGGLDCCLAVLEAIQALLIEMPGKKPLGLCNTGQFFLPLIRLLTQLEASAFLSAGWRQSVSWADRPKALLADLFSDPCFWREPLVQVFEGRIEL